MNKIIDRVENVDRGAFVSENFWHQFWRKTFSAESISKQSAKLAFSFRLARLKP